MKSWLYNKTVLVTGASGGLGFNLSKRLIEKYNCKIIGIARNEEKIKKAIETLGDKKSNFTYKIFDVSVKENWDSFSTELKEKNISIDMLINNAGFMLPFVKLEKIDDQTVNEIISTNLLSVIYSTRALMPLLKKSKTPSVVNISSAAGNCPVVGQTMYCTTKYAVKGFTQTLKQEYKDFYIGGVYPGFIKTNILHRMSVSDKENKLIQKLMQPVEKATKKIVKGIARKKQNIIIGIDGRSMSFFARIFPKATPTIVSKVLKTSKLKLFEDVFDNTKA